MKIDLMVLRDVVLVLLALSLGPTPNDGLANVLWGLCTFIGVPLLFGAAFWKLE